MKKAGIKKKKLNPNYIMVDQKADSTTTFERFSKQSLWTAGIVLVIFYSWAVFVVGLRSDHHILVAILSVTYFAGEGSRKALYGFLPFVIYWILYDSMRVYPNYMVNDVHINEPYEIEKSWFGIQTETGVLTPNEFLANHRHPFLDLIGPIFYLCWVPVPLAYTIYLYFKDKRLMLEFSLSFLLVNILGIIGYYLYPAAPPWYYFTYGSEFIANTPGSAAGLLRFDEITGLTLFEGMYNKNANVFAAVPSLHAAFPILLTYFGWKKRLKVATVIFAFITIGIWCTAVYTNHHYIIDLLAGGFCALLTLVIFEQSTKINYFEEKIQKYVKALY